MKETKINYASIITLIVFAVIFIAGAITIFVLPSDIFDVDAEEAQSMKIVFGASTALFGLLFIILAVSTYGKEKRRVAQINELLSSLGDNALVFNGKAIDKEAARENAKNTAISVAIATVFAAIFGFGVYRIHGNGTPARLFIVSDEGLLIIHPQTLDKRAYPIGKDNHLTAVSDKNGQVLVKTSLQDYYYLIKTNDTEVSQEWLINRLNDLFSQQTPQNLESPFEEI